MSATSFAIAVPPEAFGERLDRYLASCAQEDDEGPLSGWSRARLQKLIAAGHVRLDQRALEPARKLRGGERLLITVPPPVPTSLVPEPIALSVLFEDEHVIAVNKPAGLVVHPGAGHDAGTLVHGLLHHCGDLSGIGGELRPGIVHRLDRGTSGVMVVAKHDAAHVELARQLAAREVTKTYLAWVAGVPEPAAGVIDTPFGRHPTQRKKFSGRVAQGRRAVTHYATRQTLEGASELEIGLETGRTHQIRVHLSEAGWPILGDPVYGRVRWERLGERWQGHVQLERQALHAWRLALRHPMTAEPLLLAAPLPPDLFALRQSMASG